MSDATVACRVTVPLPGAAPLELEAGEAERSAFGLIADAGGYATGTLGLLARLAPPHAVILDVGAHIGIMSMALARMLPTARVHAFEPSPASVHWLHHNLVRNDLERVRVTHAAVGAAPGTLFVTDNDDYSMGTRVGDAGDVAVPAVTLDDWVRQHLEGSVDLLKIDVEGAEPAVLAGAAQTLATHRPDVLIEVNPTALADLDGRDARALWQTLRDVYPYAYWVARAGGLVPLRGADAMMRALRRHGVGDVLFRARPARSRGLRAHAAALAERAPARGTQYAVEAGLHVATPEPPPVRTGAPVTLPVLVTNGTGSRLASAGEHPVYVASRWFPADGSPPLDGPRARLRPPLRPGHSRAVSLTLHPPAPGEYDLRIALVQEHRAWLDRLGPDAAATHRVIVQR